MTEIPHPDPLAVPIGAMLPGMVGDPTPEGFMLIDGQTLTREDYPEFVENYYHAFESNRNTGDVRDSMRLWWEEHGGVVEENRVVLPVLSSDDVMKAVFGFVMHLTVEKIPVLWIRVERAPK